MRFLRHSQFSARRPIVLRIGGTGIRPGSVLLGLESETDISERSCVDCHEDAGVSTTGRRVADPDTHSGCNRASRLRSTLHLVGNLGKILVTCGAFYTRR